jgi:hypothetical protein
VRDNHRVEDIRKVDGDDPADAARYGLVSGGRLAGVGAGFTRPGGPARHGGYSQPGATHGSPNFAGSDAGTRFGASQSGAPRFVTGMPLAEQIARQVSATDPTSQAIHYQRLESEAKRQFRPKPLPRRR